MVPRSFWRWPLMAALTLLLLISLWGIWAGWQVNQAKTVLADLVDGRRISTETQLEARAERLATVARWWPHAEWQRALLLEWSAQPLKGEAARARLEKANAVLEAAIDRLPGQAFTTRAQLRLALKLGRPGDEIAAVLSRIDSQAPNNFELHRYALVLLLTVIEGQPAPVQIWAMVALRRMSEQPVMARGLWQSLKTDNGRRVACQWAGQRSELGTLCANNLVKGLH